MIQKHIDAVERDDIDALISDGVKESKTLEYKLQLPGNADKDKREFLADVSSFANASGGDIIFGLRAAVDASGKKTGAAEKVVPIVGASSDEVKLRLEEIVRNGIDPRLAIQIKEIAGFDDDGKAFVVLLRVPTTVASPHVVTFKGSFDFYSRNSAGKYPLDVEELRSAFLASDTQVERIKRFRERRLGQIVADETPVKLSTPHRLVLHLIPVSSFLKNQRIESTDLQQSTDFLPFRGYGHKRFNLDGIVTHTSDPDDGPKNKSYCQVFFNGAIESVEADLIRAEQGARPTDGVGGIASLAYEQDVIGAITHYLKGYKLLNISPPISISMALLGCKGSFLYVNPQILFQTRSLPIDRDAALLPDVIVESLDADVPQTMKPIFDAVWNACGYPRSFNYNEQGEWKPR